MMKVLKNMNDKELQNLSEDEIFNLLIEAEKFINYYNVDFSNKCKKFDEYCLFALLQKMLNINETKFAILQAKLKVEFENNIELQKELQEFFNNLKIKFKS